MAMEIARVFSRKDSDYQFPRTYRPRKEYLNVRVLRARHESVGAKRSARMRGKRLRGRRKRKKWTGFEDL